MKKVFELPELKLESLRACEAVMAVDENFELDYFNISLTNL